MTIHLNGADRETRATTISALIDELGLAPATVLVELNGTALLRSEWTAIPLAEGDHIELLRVAAGG